MNISVDCIIFFLAVIGNRGDIAELWIFKLIPVLKDLLLVVKHIALILYFEE